MNKRGFVHLVPLVIVAVVVLLGLTFKSFKIEPSSTDTKESVLSESEDVEEDRSGSPNEVRTESERRVGEQDNDQDKVEDETEDIDDDEEEDEVEEEVEVEDEDEGTRLVKIKIKNRDGEFELQAEGISARSNLPLSVNSETNELTVATPNGEKAVTVLPDRAIANMIENGVIDSSLSVEIQESDEDVQYEVEGVDEQRLLGLFDVAIARRVRVSAQSGEIIGVNQSFLSRILDLLSI